MNSRYTATITTITSDTFSDTVEAAADRFRQRVLIVLTSDGKAEISDAENELNDKKPKPKRSLPTPKQHSLTMQRDHHLRRNGACRREKSN